MSCHHQPGDPNCSSYPGWKAREDAKIETRIQAAIRSSTVDADNYEIIDVEEIGPHLVMKVRYPSCAKCAFEGDKVMVFLYVKTKDVLKWKRIDPHFRDAKTGDLRAAPSPAARFPPTTDGWQDAVRYAESKRPVDGPVSQ